MPEHLQETSCRRNAIRHFHEARAKKFYESESNLETYSDVFFHESLIGSLMIETAYDHSERVKIIPKLQKINQVVPQIILDTFDRHIWFSQYNLSSIFIVRLPINELDSFAVLIQGIFSDWWDNGCILLELFDGQGIPMGAAADISFTFEHSDHIPWLDRQLNGDDYSQIAPPYPKDFPDRELQSEIEAFGNPVWLLESDAEFFYLPEY
jgi:hypothetical protein